MVFRDIAIVTLNISSSGTNTSTEMSSLPSGSPPGRVSNDALATAAELRTHQAAPQLTAAQKAVEYEKRQKFRRLLDPGITRPNSKEQALNSLRVSVFYSLLEP